jgi:hypothetical protein
MHPESNRPFDRRGRELEARRSPPARFTFLLTRRKLPQQRKPKQTAAYTDFFTKPAQSHPKPT